MITSFELTNRGDREINEDSIGVFEEGSRFCALVCDGLGGHGHGEIASALAVQEFKNTFELKENKFLSTAFEKAQARILQEQNLRATKGEMKTTAVCLYVEGNRLAWGHIGDSRLYAFKKNKIKIHTYDHSVPQMLVYSRQIKEKQIRNHPDRNRLLKVLGTEWESTQYELSDWYDFDAFDSFLLCSDGFWELIEDKQMEKTLKRSETPQQWISQMTEIVRKNGAGKNMDNYSAIAVWIE